MVTVKEIITFECDMCGKMRQKDNYVMPHNWQVIANKHHCAHCKRLVGKTPRNLSTEEIRRSLMQHPNYRRVK